MGRKRGRPRTIEDGRMLSVRVPAGDLMQVRELAKARGVPASIWLRQVIGAGLTTAGMREQPGARVG